MATNVRVYSSTAGDWVDVESLGGGGGGPATLPNLVPATRSGFFISPPTNVGTPTAVSAYRRTLIAIPITREVTIDGLGFWCIDGTTQTAVSMALYDDTGTAFGLASSGGYPGALIRNTADIDVTGLVNQTVAGAVTPITLTPGLWWAGWRSDATGSVTCAVGTHTAAPGYLHWPWNEYPSTANSGTYKTSGLLWTGGGSGWAATAGAYSWDRFAVLVSLRVAS